MPKIDVAAVPEVAGSRYPEPFDEPCKRRFQRRLAEAGGLTQFGVNITRLAPHAWSSQRHWHSHEDELVYVLQGEVVLVADGGEEVMRPGDCAAFPAGTRDGHCFQNRTNEDVLFITVGSRVDEDHGEYSDIDLVFTAGRYSGKSRYLHKDGTPYDAKR